jgi:serine protease Do
MKYLALIGALLLVGCATPEEHSVALAMKSTVMVEVRSIDKVVLFKGTPAEVNLGTAPVRSRGAGVFVSETGHILSAAHIFRHGNITRIDVTLRGGDTTRAELLNVDTAKDLALLKVERRSLKTLIRRPGGLYAGQSVFVIGYPLGEYDFSVAHGIISSISRTGFIQMDAPLNPGNSGGPVFAQDGTVAGIVSWGRRDGAGLTFAVSADVIRDYLSKFKGL